MKGGSDPLLRSVAGAIYVEFLIAFLPLFIFFMCLVQMAGLHTARLALLHGAEMAARAAVVVLPDDPARYGNVPVGQIEGKRRDDILRAAQLPMGAVRSLIGVKVTFPSSAGGDDDRTAVGRDDLVRVKVTALYRCSIPLARHIVCSVADATRTMTAEAALPNQGADYGYE